MDTTLLQLFEMDEIFERIGRSQLTGSFHAFIPGASADVVFESGWIVGASKGQLEGEEALEQILNWKHAHYFWETKATVPTPRKPIRIDAIEFMAKRKPNGKPASDSGKLTSFRVTPSANPIHPHVLIQSMGSTTGPLSDLPTQPQPRERTGRVKMTATKTINPDAESRAANDAELLTRFRLVLVSIDKPEEMRFSLTQISTLAGRNPACDIPIPHPSISRQHCLLQITQQGLLVKDMNTTNGTKVNGTLMKEGYVNVGDRLTIGHLPFVLDKE